MYSHLKTASLCTKTTIKSVSAPLQALDEGRGQKGRAEEGEEVEEEEEGEVETVRKKEEEGGEEKAVTERVEPVLVLKFGIGVVAGKSWEAERGKTEGGGRGERRSAGAVGGRSFWHNGEEGEERETGSRGEECLGETGSRLGEAGNMVETGR